MRYRIPILLFVSIFLGMVHYWPQSEDSAVRMTLKVPAEKDIDTIRVKPLDAPEIILKKTAEGWVLNDGEPLDTAIEKRLKETLADTMHARFIQGDHDAQHFGLDTSRISVVFEGESPLELHLGRVKNKRTTFVRADGHEGVYRVPANLLEIFQKSPDEWVEKRLFKDEIKSVRRVSLEREGHTMWVVERGASDAPWIMDTPRGMEAGQMDVNAVVGTLVGARAVEFPDRSSFIERGRLIFNTLEGQQYALRLGPKNERGGVLSQAMVLEKGEFRPLRPIALLPPHVAIFLEPTARDLRNRIVFPVRSNAVGSIVVSGRPEIRAEHKEGRWTVSIDGSPVEGQRHIIDGWVDSVVGLKSTGFVDRGADDAFHEISGQVTLRLKNDRVITLDVGKTYGNGRHGRTSDRPQRVFVLSQSVLNGLRPRAEYFSGPRIP